MKRWRQSGPPTRRRSTATPRLELLVFTEGERTEEIYLTDMYRRSQRPIVLRVSSYHGEPRQLVDRAVQEKNGSRRRPGDQIWCVFDRDEFAHFEAACQKAAANDINVAISNPCLELWFVLHFKDQRAHIDRDAVQRLCSSLVGVDKTLTPKSLERLDTLLPDAIGRAKYLARMHETNGNPQWENPSSGIWRLIETFRTA
jgi:hypothetical protein